MLATPAFQASSNRALGGVFHPPTWSGGWWLAIELNITIMSQCNNVISSKITIDRDKLALVIMMTDSIVGCWRICWWQCSYVAFEANVW